MTEQKHCRSCGAALPAQSPEGLCPKCLLEAGFEPCATDEGDDLRGRIRLSGNPAPIAPEAGTRIGYFGDYELLAEIARGGMGVVYKARQTSLNRVVVLKMILAGQLADEQVVNRFHAEAEAAAQLDHPGIVPIFEVGQHDGQHYFSMGFIEGESLADRIKDGPVRPQHAAELVKQIAEAVAYAHQKGVVHRDLKPANVLVGRSGSARVTDFGLAKLVKGDSGLTATGQIVGTPSFMSPEQARGKSDEVGPLSDVYSLGAILYCLLTGRPPFHTATPIDTLKQVLDREPVSVSTHAPTHSAAGWAMRQRGLSTPELPRSAHPDESHDWFVNTIGMTMVRIRSGGGVPGVEYVAEDAGLPDVDEDLVLTRSFLPSDRETSRGEYQLFVDDPGYPDEDKPADWSINPSFSPTPAHPVHNVSWYDAVVFCNWLSRREV